MYVPMYYCNSFAYCYLLVDVISLSISKSDQIKRVYCKLFDWNFKLVQLLIIVQFETRTAWAVFKYCGTELHHQEG